MYFLIFDPPLIQNLTTQIIQAIRIYSPRSLLKTTKTAKYDSENQVLQKVAIKFLPFSCSHFYFRHLSRCSMTPDSKRKIYNKRIQSERGTEKLERKQN